MTIPTHNLLQRMTHLCAQHDVDVHKLLLAYNGLNALNDALQRSLKDSRIRQPLPAYHIIFSPEISRSKRYMLRSYHVLVEKGVISDKLVRPVPSYGLSALCLQTSIENATENAQRILSIESVVLLIDKLPSVLLYFIDAFLEQSLSAENALAMTAQRLNMIIRLSLLLLSRCCYIATKGSPSEVQFCEQLHSLSLDAISFEELSTLPLYGLSAIKPPALINRQFLHAMTPHLLSSLASSNEKAQYVHTVQTLENLYTKRMRSRIVSYFAVVFNSWTAYGDSFKGTKSKKSTAGTTPAVATVPEVPPETNTQATTESPAQPAPRTRRAAKPAQATMEIKLVVGIHKDKLSVRSTSAILQHDATEVEVHQECKPLLKALSQVVESKDQANVATQLNTQLQERQKAHALTELQAFDGKGALSEETRRYLRSLI